MDRGAGNEKASSWVSHETLKNLAISERCLSRGVSAHHRTQISGKISEHGEQERQAFIMRHSPDYARMPVWDVRKPLLGPHLDQARLTESEFCGSFLETVSFGGLVP